MRFSVLLLWVFGIGCGTSTAPGDGGGEDAVVEDGFVDPRIDSDEDGLCDATERERGTDPFLADTDFDGFLDSTEITLGFNPLGNTSPDRDTVFFLRENPASALQVSIERVIRGRGENYTGAFESLGDPDLGGATAATFYVESLPVFADPPDNVALIDEENEVFRAVTGTTLLGYEARFAFGDAVPRVCNRAYSWRYNVKRSDGALVAANRYVIVVLPTGATMGDAWCLPEGGCF